MKAEVLKEQARLHEQREEWVQAIDLYAKAVDELDREDQPDLALYNRLGDLEIRMGNVEAAVDHYERAIDLYLESELPNNAIAICRKVVRNLPTRHHIFLKMGQIRAKQGFLTDARSNFLEYADRMQRMEDLEEAFRALIEFVELAPDDIEAKLALATQLEAHERTAEAVEQYIVIHQRLVLKERDEEAVEIAAKIQSLDPEAVIPPPPDPQLDDGALAFETTSLASGFPEPSVEIEEADQGTEVEADLGAIQIVESDEPPAVADSPEEPAADFDPETSFADLAVDPEFGDISLDVSETEPDEAIAELDVGEADPAESLDDFGFGELELGEAGSATELDVNDLAVAEDKGSFDDDVLDEGDPLPLISFEDDDPVSGLTTEDAEADDQATQSFADIGPAGDGDKEGVELQASEPAPESETDIAAAQLEDGTDRTSTSLDGEFWSDGHGAASEVDEAEEWPAQDVTTESADAGAEEGWPDAEPALAAVDSSDDDGWPDEQVSGEPEAVVSLQAQLEHDPDDGEAWLALSEEFFSQNRADESTLAAEQAVTSFHKRNDTGGAIRALEALVSHEPDRTEYRQRLVELAIQKNDSEVLANAYIGLADCLVRAGVPDRARTIFQQVLITDPDNALAIEGLESLETAPSAPATEVASSEDYVDLGSMVLDDEDEKTTRWKVAAEEPTGDDEADFAKMLSQFKEKVAENLDADDIAAHYDLGTAYKEMGLVDEAISEFQQALRAEAFHLPTHELLGQCFMEKEQYEVAVHSMGRALEVGSQVEDELLGIYYQLARSHQELGNKGDALEFYEKVFALDINFQDVTERLRELR